MNASLAFPGDGRNPAAAHEVASALLRAQPCSFDIRAARERLAERGGYEIVHESPGLEVGVYVLVAPEPDHQQPHVDDEVYVVLEGSGILDIEGKSVEVHEGLQLSCRPALTTGSAPTST